MGKRELSNGEMVKTTRVFDGFNMKFSMRTMLQAIPVSACLAFALREWREPIDDRPPKPRYRCGDIVTYVREDTPVMVQTEWTCHHYADRWHWNYKVDWFDEYGQIQWSRVLQEDDLQEMPNSRDRWNTSMDRYAEHSIWERRFDWIIPWTDGPDLQDTSMHAPYPFIQEWKKWEPEFQ